MRSGTRVGSRKSVGEDNTKVRKPQEETKLTNRKTEKRTTARRFYLLFIWRGEGREYTNNKKRESETTNSKMMPPATDPNGNVDEEKRFPKCRKIY